ncbi:hypothetical protein FCOIX_7945 [Fusarium coicis]|nr:hypothetical protein FCOIX_7945 [Fusarium coicis]
MTDQVVDHSKASAYSYWCAFVVETGSLLWGYDSGIFGTALAQSYFEEKFRPSSSILGGIISLYTAGGAIGALLSGPVGNRCGRLGMIRIGAVIAVIGTTLQTAATETIMLIFGRLIAGLAIGLIYFAIPIFLSEIAPFSRRDLFTGRILSLSYRFPVGLQVLLALALLCLSFTIPESPRYLIERGELEQAEAVLKRLWVPSGDGIERELRQMRDQIQWERENEESSLKVMVTKPSYRKRLLLGCRVQIGQQICGISAVNYYQTIMYKSLGIKGHAVLLLAGVWGITGPLANIFCLLWIIDRVRRRNLFMAGSLAMAVDIAIVLSLVAVYGGSNNQAANSAGIFFLILFGILFSLSWNSGAPVYTAEIFPTQIRATGGAVSTFWSFIIQVVLAQASPTALANVGWRYYFFFIVMNIATLALVFFFLPETKGKSLEEISEVFGDIFVSVHMDERLDEKSEHNVRATTIEAA